LKVCSQRGIGICLMLPRFFRVLIQRNGYV
jgi:hypothetical protein